MLHYTMYTATDRIYWYYTMYTLKVYNVYAQSVQCIHVAQCIVKIVLRVIENAYQMYVALLKIPQ